MATNTGNGYRKGGVKNRKQIFNPKTGLWGKVDTTTGKIMDVKTTEDAPFKGVRKDK